MEENETSLSYKIIKGLIRLFYPRIQVIGTENLPNEPALIVGNHSQMHGPIACELYFPGCRYTWCAGEMMHWKEVPAYAYRDFWSQKPKRSRWFYKILAYLVTPISVCVFNNANTIGVYHDSRVLSTFKNTVSKLCGGANVIVFPEHDVRHNHIVYDFQDKFIDIARLYYKKTGKELSFIPLYIAPKRKEMHLGKPIYFDHTAPMDDERQRIKAYLMAQITEIACALPSHTVIPYRNIPKKDYPTNTRKEAENEKACR